jgi:tetratricopeptide (TPR) repeat protein
MAKKANDKAITEYTKTIRFDPNDAAAYASRGDAYYEKGGYYQAAAVFTRAAKIDPAYAKRILPDDHN